MQYVEITNQTMRKKMGASQQDARLMEQTKSIQFHRSVGKWENSCDTSTSAMQIPLKPIPETNAMQIPDGKLEERRCSDCDQNVQVLCS